MELSATIDDFWPGQPPGIRISVEALRLARVFLCALRCFLYQLSGYLKAIWPDFWDAFLSSGRPWGPGKALKKVAPRDKATFWSSQLPSARIRGANQRRPLGEPRPPHGEPQLVQKTLQSTKNWVPKGSLA